jgi:hypothetical protein
MADTRLDEFPQAGADIIFGFVNRSCQIAAADVKAAAITRRVEAQPDEQLKTTVG